MKVLAGLLCVSTAFKAYFVSAEAFIYTSDIPPHQPREDLPSVTPLTARLLLAQRLGLSQYHSLEDADESTIQILNNYGGKQQQIFAHEDRSEGTGKLLLVVEGVANPNDIFDDSIIPAFAIDPQPSSGQNLDLAFDFLEQDRDSRTKDHNLCYLQSQNDENIRGGLSSSRITRPQCAAVNDYLRQESSPRQKFPLTAYLDASEFLASISSGHTIILHVSSLQGLTPANGNRYSTVLSEIKTFIHHFHKPNSPISSTILIMSATSKTTKRSATSPYGSYTKRFSSRQQQTEEPLSSPPTASSPSFPEILPLQASTPPLPHGILPVCHPSLESAVSATNNCSGHGIAYKKSGGAIDCFACKCSNTRLTDDQGRVKTVYWGGPACQKKDISVPFFLLAGLSIALVGAVTWGVGLMASVGQEELPSVIGAGVAGPRVQK